MLNQEAKLNVSLIKKEKMLVKMIIMIFVVHGEFSKVL
jgi:hypothetical protein